MKASDFLMLREFATTLYPRSRNDRTTPAPMPCEAPVTMTVFCLLAILLFLCSLSSLSYEQTVHLGSSVPACSAAMYAAYQSGQFASRCPLCFSCSPWAAAARRIALARSFADAKVVVAGSMRPGNRRLTSWTIHAFPS